MKILVTGGAGFIGSHTVDALIKDGHNVRILDNLQKPVHLNGKPSYLPKDAEFILGDVRNKRVMEYALEGVDTVFHFAAYQDYLTDFSRFFNVNSRGTALLYEIIVEENFPVKKIVVASSQMVMGEGKYKCPAHGEFVPAGRSNEQLKCGQWDHKCPYCGGEVQMLPSDETVVSPPNQYAISKYSQEMIALNLGKRYKIPSTALRYSIVQGPRQSFYNAYSGACRIFSLHYFLKKQPTAYEDGNAIRDYININDVVEANLLVLKNPRTDYEVYNVGGGEKYTVMEFGKIVAKIYGSDVLPKIPGEYRIGDTRHIFSDISKLKKLGWMPQVPIEKSVLDYKKFLEEQTDVGKAIDYAERKMKKVNIVRKAKKNP
jgi:dTDP-L-rhamnose 4-epimerase